MEETKLVAQYQADPAMGKEVWKATYKKYGTFRLGLALTIAVTGGFVFDIANMADWMLYGCGAVNVALHIGAAALLAVLWGASFRVMRMGGRKSLTAQYEAVDVFKDHICIKSSPLKRKDMKLRRRIYYCDISGMEYDPKKQRLAIHADCSAKKTVCRNGRPPEMSVKETRGGTFYIYRWYREYGEMMELLQMLSYHDPGYVPPGMR